MLVTAELMLIAMLPVTVVSRVSNSVNRDPGMLTMQAAVLQLQPLLLRGVSLSFDLVNGNGLGHAYSGYALRKNFKAKTAADCTFQVTVLRNSPRRLWPCQYAIVTTRSRQGEVSMGLVPRTWWLT